MHKCKSRTSTLHPVFENSTQSNCGERQAVNQLVDTGGQCYCDFTLSTSPATNTEKQSSEIADLQSLQKGISFSSSDLKIIIEYLPILKHRKLILFCFLNDFAGNNVKLVDGLSIIVYMRNCRGKFLLSCTLKRLSYMIKLEHPLELHNM